MLTVCANPVVVLLLFSEESDASDIFPEDGGDAGRELWSKLKSNFVASSLSLRFHSWLLLECAVRSIIDDVDFLMGLRRKVLSMVPVAFLNVLEMEFVRRFFLSKKGPAFDGDEGEVRGWVGIWGEFKVILSRLSSSGSETAALPETSA